MVLVKGRFSTLHPVSEPSQPEPALCPLSPHICKSLNLSGLDLTERAGLSQTSHSLPGLNGLDALSQSNREGQSSPSPCTSSEHWSAQNQRRLSIPLKGFCSRALDSRSSAVSRVLGKTIQKTKQRPRGWSK